jgi:hypothetical protein
MDDDRLVALRKKKDEEDEAFMKRFDLTPADLSRWKTLTKDGTTYGGPALKRFFGSD